MAIVEVVLLRVLVVDLCLILIASSRARTRHCTPWVLNVCAHLTRVNTWDIVDIRSINIQFVLSIRFGYRNSSLLNVQAWLSRQLMVTYSRWSYDVVMVATVVSNGTVDLEALITKLALVHIRALRAFLPFEVFHSDNLRVSLLLLLRT